MSTTTATVTLNATQHAALVKVSKGNPADDTLRPSTVQALIRRDLVEIDPDGLLSLTKGGHAFLDAKDTSQEPRGTRMTPTKDKGARVSEKPATGRKRALGSDGVLRKRIAPQLLAEFGKIDGFDKALATAIASTERESDGAVWLPVDVARLDALTAYCETVKADKDAAGGARRAASAFIRRVASYHRPQAQKLTKKAAPA
jgi:hypothetical protein